VPASPAMAVWQPTHRWISRGWRWTKGNVYVSEAASPWQPPNVVRILQPLNQPILVSAVLDAASEQPEPVSPGKIVVIYGAGLGPAELVRNSAVAGQVGTELAGTEVFFNGVAAPILYTSGSQIGAIAPYALNGQTAQVTVTYQGHTSSPVAVPIAGSAPSLFTTNQTGAGEAAAINVADGTVNSAANPAKVGGYVTLYATGEGQTTPTGVDGKIAAGATLPQPNLSVSATIGGVPAVVQYAGTTPGQVAGLMQVNLQIPSGVQPGGYVPVVLKVGSATSSTVVWIAVAD